MLSMSVTFLILNRIDKSVDLRMLYAWTCSAGISSEPGDWYLFKILNIHFDYVL